VATDTLLLPRQLLIVLQVSAGEKCSFVVLALFEIFGGLFFKAY
jgi:hypothetical protein